MARSRDKKSVFAYLHSTVIDRLERIVPATHHREQGARISLTTLVLGVVDVVEYAWEHRAASGAATFVGWLQEAVVVRSRIDGPLVAGATVSAAPATLSERAKLFPVPTRADILWAYMIHHDRHHRVPGELGATPGELARAMARLPGLADEIHAAASRAP